jgi:ATP-binding cassette subfamily C (CFTR/MRP) protein 1
MSNDAQKFFEFCPMVHIVWAAPLQIACASYFLILYLGTSAAAGICAIMMVVPLNVLLAKVQVKWRRAHMPFTDERVKICSEVSIINCALWPAISAFTFTGCRACPWQVLQGIRAIKYYSWESAFIRKIMDTRQAEMRYVLKELLCIAFMISILVACTVRHVLMCAEMCTVVC